MRKNTKEEFLSKARLVHNESYSYDKFEYLGSETKSIITCLDHGDFLQSPYNHLIGYGCRMCGNDKKSITKRDKALKQFMERAKEVHGGKYTYTTYIDAKTRVDMICPEHGVFQQAPYTHLISKMGCPKCAQDVRTKKRRLSQEEFVKRAKKAHPDKNYDYSEAKYIKSTVRVKIICPSHGAFFSTPNNHLFGTGCPTCANTNRPLRVNTDDFITRAKKIHGESKYDYSLTVYTGIRNRVTIVCPKHGKFSQVADYHLNGNGCKSCGNRKSRLHRKLEELFPTAQSDVKGLLTKGLEVDLYFPEYKFGVELHGVYYHSSKFNKDPMYHEKKYISAKENGIDLLQVWDDGDVDVFLLASMIKARCGLIEKRVFARKCIVKHISHKEYDKFLTSNHIQGTVSATVKLGLFENDRLVAVSGFLREKNKWTLVRYCQLQDTLVVGGASKTLKYFINEYNPDKITTYSDNMYSNGDMYAKLGFRLVSESRNPRLYYTNERGELANRRSFQKAELKKRHPTLDLTKTERELAESLGWYQLWGAKTKKWEFLRT